MSVCSQQEVKNRIQLNVKFDAAAVRNKLSKLRPDKSMGPDGFHPKLLRECADELSEPLSIIYALSYEEGSLPQDWKQANVTPIFKKGNKNEASNYRPVSLTSVVCKVMESIIRDELIKVTEANGIFPDEQHGFRTGRSCRTNLLETFEEWTKLIDKGSGFDAIYLDFRKAFDTVPHRRLIHKLASYGFDQSLIAWIESFLTTRIP